MPNRVDDMMRAACCYPFCWAATNNRTQVTHHLLHSPVVFGWVENRHHKYLVHFVRPFAAHRIETWRRERSNQHDDRLDLDNNACQLGFYVARHLIRENTAAARENLRFLLSIPGIASRAHIAMTPDQPNELLRLALRLGNSGAAGQLLELPAVRELADIHHHDIGTPRRTTPLSFFATSAHPDTSLILTSTQGAVKR